MTDITLKTLQETREQLKASLGQLEELRKEGVTGDSAMLARVELQMEQITALKEKFIEQREALSTVLPDGTKLWPDQYQALERFASNNQLHIESVLSRITVEGGIVIACDFFQMNLTTLSGLEGLVRLRKLDVSYNRHLTSLKGIPTQAIEEIWAWNCGLTGDLSELSGADKLKLLGVGGNKGLTSLKGIPTQAIEGIGAQKCGLTGDLSELSGADKLKSLTVSDNNGLTSLKGIPTQAIEEIYAWDCGLTGDLSELSGADKLKWLNVDDNQGLTSLKGIPTQAIEYIYAYECGLAGDHTFLSKAPHLKELNVKDNPSLTLNKRKFNSRVKVEI
jgi:hypothetical protein